MFCCRLSLFCVLGILCICFFAGSSHSKKCVEPERQALLRLKAGFVRGREVLSSWKGEDCCKWQGILCDDLTCHVTGLDLDSDLGDQLEGKLDSSICELQHLTSLNLNSNFLEGKIPKCIGSLGQLIELELKENEFVGVIPSTLGNLSHLQTLQLGYNFHLNTNDLEWVSHLSNLRFLNLELVNLSQAIDWLSSINKIPSLSELYLCECGLPQVNPKSIPHLNSSTSLKKLDLSYNNLNTLTLLLVLNVSKVLTNLDLSGNELEGGLPESFQSLCQLKELQLTDNNLSGQLNDNIQQLRCAQNGLEVLQLDHNPFSSGQLPDFSWLSSLRKLSLQNTSIIGSFPQLSGHMPHLDFLDLSYNRLNGVGSINEAHLSNLSTLRVSFNELSGSLPLFEISKLASLEVLDLSNNHLNGSLPLSIGQLSNLDGLYLFSNKLNGFITEAHLSNLSRLTKLGVSQNSLSFNLSSNWVPPFQLQGLYASSCILGPKFPTWLKHQRNLTELDISYAGISDLLPKWVWDQYSSLWYLNASYNKLSGAISKSVQSLKPVHSGTWDFSFNNLNGPLPPFPKVGALFLSNNRFSGSLSSFCASSPWELTYLDLSRNLLEGPIPNCWGKFQNLEYLNLAKNKLSGRIPNSFGTLRQMVSLHLNNNNLSGEIPSLALCTNLGILDLGDNNLQGTLPAWVGYHLHHLIVLSLRANKLEGRLPESLCNLPFLQVLDISRNNITGEISQCLNHIISLSNIQFPRKRISQYLPLFTLESIGTGSFDEKATLAWKGEDREYGKNLGLMTIIDLSSNHLTGDIPQSITKLVALAGLNLSRNNLTGFIPKNIGQMERLESLDLSKNYLYGRMPESFSNLSFLSYMDLSFNNLSGTIPRGTQLQSFNASTYVGNNGLCGLPLTNHCPGDVTSSAKIPDKHATDEDKDADELITFGFYISLGLGFFVGFWGIFGTLVMKASWRHAYFQFFNNMKDHIHVKIVVFTARMRGG
ncbi:receptor-like protein EIX2 [Lotus japonicus]|uniref:receptor-like protein EIX2 n=1 Tax=Lotus japonicus TaxID=34305 RepID=UPI0025870279|nr:receptor-like protein EIX2 [Lotus japonicus]XP_057458695.1 receptor-like protein EIX2 [Lotus japonicus]